MPTKIRIFTRYWTVADVERHSNCLFVYGDNDAHFGKGGQAIIRELPNTAGIPTKKYPTNNSRSFYRDSELSENQDKIDAAVDSIIDRSNDYKYVVLPQDGFGTGLADLPRRAPKTYDYLLKAVDRLKSSI